MIHTPQGIFPSREDLIAAVLTNSSIRVFYLRFYEGDFYRNTPQGYLQFYSSRMWASSRFASEKFKDVIYTLPDRPGYYKVIGMSKSNKSLYLLEIWRTKIK